MNGKYNGSSGAIVPLFECMQPCARNVLDTGRHCQRHDITPIVAYCFSLEFHFCGTSLSSGGHINSLPSSWGRQTATAPGIRYEGFKSEGLRILWCDLENCALPDASAIHGCAIEVAQLV